MKQARARDARDWIVSVTREGVTERRSISAVSSHWACANAAFDLGVRSDDLIVIAGPHRCTAKTRAGVVPALTLIAGEVE